MKICDLCGEKCDRASNYRTECEKVSWKIENKEIKTTFFFVHGERVINIIDELDGKTVNVFFIRKPDRWKIVATLEEDGETCAEIIEEQEMSFFPSGEYVDIIKERLWKGEGRV